MSRPSLREQLDELEFICATGDLTHQKLYDTLFVGNAASANADAWIQSRGGDPLAWGVFPENSWVFATDDTGLVALLRYPDGTWHLHNAESRTEDGRVPQCDDDPSINHPYLVHELLTGMRTGETMVRFIDPELMARLQPEDDE